MTAKQTPKRTYKAMKERGWVMVNLRTDAAKQASKLAERLSVELGVGVNRADAIGLAIREALERHSGK